ncbi:hypothetical protein Tco_0622807, partial [Tanacetum coccineum]
RAIEDLSSLVSLIGNLALPDVEDGTVRTKKYEELSATEKIQADSIAKQLILFFKVFHRMFMLLSIIIKLQKRFGTELSF